MHFVAGRKVPMCSMTLPATQVHIYTNKCEGWRKQLLEEGLMEFKSSEQYTNGWNVKFR